MYINVQKKEEKRSDVFWLYYKEDKKMGIACLFCTLCGIMSLAESCVYAEDSIRRKTHGDGSRRGIMFALKNLRRIQ